MLTIAVKAGQKRRQIRKLLKALQSEKVRKYIEETY